MPTAVTFRADRFSIATPAMRIPEQEAAREIEELIAGHFSDACPSVRKVERYGGLEVNSHNYLVHSNGNTFVLKKVPTIGLKPHVESCKIANWLCGQQVRMPQPIEGNNGDFVVTTEQGCWSLWQHVPGNYFTGRVSELSDLAAAIATLSKALARLPRTLHRQAQVPLDIDDIRHTLREAMDTTTGPIPDQLAPYLAVVERTESELLRAYEDIVSNRQDHLSDPDSHCHIDLHPHNVLLIGDKVSAIVDVDSISRYPKLIGNGFAAFKMFRQVIVHSGDGSVDQLGERFRTFCNEIDQTVPPALLLKSALIEVSRRSHYILREYLDKGESQWADVLGIQLSACDEIYSLLGKVGQ